MGFTQLVTDLLPTFTALHSFTGQTVDLLMMPEVPTEQLILPNGPAHSRAWAVLRLKGQGPLTWMERRFWEIIHRLP